MTNPNVEALCRIFCDAALKLSWDDINADRQTNFQIWESVRRIATFMADRGVLVISDAVLTDERCKAVWEATGAEQYDNDENFAGFAYAEYRSGLRDELSRLAKGE